MKYTLLLSSNAVILKAAPFHSTYTKKVSQPTLNTGETCALKCFSHLHLASLPRFLSYIPRWMLRTLINHGYRTVPFDATTHRDSHPWNYKELATLLTIHTGDETQATNHSTEEQYPNHSTTINTYAQNSKAKK